MKLPVVDNACTTPEPNCCTFCNQPMPLNDSDIWIGVGALQGTADSQTIVDHNDVFAFFLIREHNAKLIDIVKSGRGGQADIGFCSTQCLRDFFNLLVDELEKEQL